MLGTLGLHGALARLVSTPLSNAMSLTRERLVPTEQKRMRYCARRSYMGRQSIRVVDRLFDLSEGHALYLQHPLRRIWRDVHATGQHLALHFEVAMAGYGRTLVGLPSWMLM